MKKLIFTLSICVAALAVSAQPASKRHGHSNVKIDGNKAQVWNAKSHGHSDNAVQVNSVDANNHQFMAKKHGHSDVKIEGNKAQVWAGKKHGRTNVSLAAKQNKNTEATYVNSQNAKDKNKN